MLGVVYTWLAAALLFGFAALGCGPPDSQQPGVGAGLPFAALSAADAAALSGSYEVQGLTVQAVSGQQREISGSLEMTVREGGPYEVTFELHTTAPDLPGDVPVQVRGTGRGFLIAGTFTGTTEEWMTLEPPAGGLEAADLSAELPALAGRKLVSISQASLDDAGVLHILLQNQPGGDDSYEPSMTVLAGRRVGGLAARP